LYTAGSKKIIASAKDDNPLAAAPYFILPAARSAALIEQKTHTRAIVKFTGAHHTYLMYFYY